MRFRFDSFGFQRCCDQLWLKFAKRRSNINLVFFTTILLTLIILLLFKKANESLFPENVLSFPQSIDDISLPVSQRNPTSQALFDSKNKVAMTKKSAENSLASDAVASHKIVLPLRDTFRRLSGNKQMTPQKPILEPPSRATSKANHKIKKQRFVLVQAGTFVGGLAGFRKMQNIFGGIAQPFRIGNDWDSDNAIHFDELLHFQGSYRLAQGIADLYKWSGVGDNTADLLGLGLTVSAMTFLEYLDGRRANDYASYSDLAANLLGVTFAYMKPRVPLFQKIDFHVSYERITDPLRSQSLANYDRITQWITYDLSSHTRLPVELAIGYRVKHAYSSAAKPELHIGLGFSLVKLLRAGSQPQPLRIFDAYLIGLGKRLM